MYMVEALFFYFCDCVVNGAEAMIDIFSNSMNSFLFIIHYATIESVFW